MLITFTYNKFRQMSTTKKHKKMIINSVDELNMMKGIMKADAFFAKFEVSMSVVTKLAARDALIHDSMTDVAMTVTQKKMLLNGEF